MTFSTDLLARPAAERRKAIVHDLLHLRVPNHGPLFRSLLRAFPAESHAWAIARMLPGAGMKHATAATLAVLQPLLAELRKVGRLTERTPACFYLGSKAFLHFHEDASGTYADVKLDLAEFTRLRVSSPEEQTDFLQRVRRSLRGR